MLSSSGATRTGRWVGTLDYIAPEQIRGGRIDARADVYALGGVLHYVLTGHVPFERDGDEAKLWAQLSEPPPAPSTLRPDTPVALDAVVARAMAKVPDERFPSAGDLARAARAAATGAAPAKPERMVARGGRRAGYGSDRARARRGSLHGHVRGVAARAPARPQGGARGRAACRGRRGRRRGAGGRRKRAAGAAESRGRPPGPARHGHDARRRPAPDRHRLRRRRPLGHERERAEGDPDRRGDGPRASRASARGRRSGQHRRLSGRHLGGGPARRRGDPARRPHRRGGPPDPDARPTAQRRGRRERGLGRDRRRDGRRAAGATTATATSSRASLSTPAWLYSRSAPTRLWVVDERTNAWSGSSRAPANARTG